MTTETARERKPYAGSPQVRFDEGEAAPAVTPRRGALQYKNVIKCGLCLLLMIGLAAAGCSNDSSHDSGGGGIMSLFEKHKKVQLWKDGPYWAETNIGAENPWDFGYYFWWGDTIGYKRVNDAWVASDGSSSDFSFDSEHTPTCDKSEVDLLKEGWVKDTRFSGYSYLPPEHDAAHVHWGGEWRMPTEMELSELVSECDWTWMEIKGVGGYVVRGKGAYATASIFLPAAGHGDGKSHRSGGWAGDYWSSVPRRVGDSFAVALFFYSDRHNTGEFNGRDNGYPIRPVQGFTNVKECGKNEKEVLDLCKHVAGLETGQVTMEQIEEFRGSEGRTTRYAAFYKTITAAGISGDVAMSELARFAFHDPKNANKKADTVMAAYDHVTAEDVKPLGAACRDIRNALAQGGVDDARIVRYLVGFLVATPEDRQKMVGDCAVFVQMYGVVADFVRETVIEAEDADVIFTDGSLDAELRDEIKRRNLKLQPCSMMASPKPTEEQFLEKVKSGAAAQLGFDILRKARKSVSELQFSGVLFRQDGMSNSVRMRGIESAERLASRILDIQRRDVVDSLKDEEMRRKFLSVQWRIARMACVRAEQERRLGLGEQSKRSLEIASQLDECNSAVRRLRQKMADAGEKARSGLSAKERLRIALSRADFEEAQKPAREILAATPDEPDANFAVAMWHYEHKRWNDAEKYLLRCRDGRPKEVAVLNNLAMVYLKTGRLDEARMHARQALSLMPDSADVKDTLSQIEKAIEGQR